MLVMMVQLVPSQSDQTLHIISIYIVYHECNVIYSHILHIYLVHHRHVHSSPYTSTCTTVLQHSRVQPDLLKSHCSSRLLHPRLVYHSVRALPYLL